MRVLRVLTVPLVAIKGVYHSSMRHQSSGDPQLHIYHQTVESSSYANTPGAHVSVSTGKVKITTALPVKIQNPIELYQYEFHNI